MIESIGDFNIPYKRTMVAGAYVIFKYLLKQVSANRVTEMKANLLKAYERIPYDNVWEIVLANSGLNIDEI